MLGQLSCLHQGKLFVFVLLIFLIGCKEKPGCIFWFSGSTCKEICDICSTTCRNEEDCNICSNKEKCMKKCFEVREKREEEICRRGKKEHKERREKENWP